MSALDEEKAVINSGDAANKLAINAAGGPITTKAWYADLIKNTNDQLVNNSKQAAATAAVTGGSGEYIAAQKAQNGKFLTDSINAGAKHANDNDMSIANAKVNNTNNTTSQLVNAIDLNEQRRQAFVNSLVTGLTGTAQSVAGAFI